MLRLMAEAADVPQELLPGTPLIEITGITGNQRVLIENHLGVTEYQRDMIRVRVRSGAVVVCGCRLNITRMAQRQLVIAGEVQRVELERGKSC